MSYGASINYSSFRSDSYVTRTLLALVHVAYYVMVISFYVTCFLSLVIDRSSLKTTASLNSKNDTYYVLLVLNCFKPLAWLLIIYYDTRYYHSNVDAIVSGAVLLCVFSASLALEVVMLYEYFFYCNASNVHYNNPCNDLLYCCYYPNNPTCDVLWGSNAIKTCYYANLPKEIASGVRWRESVDVYGVDNTTLLSETVFKLTPDREFIVCLSINTIIMIAEFWFFLVNMKRISDKIKKFTKDNDQQFEPLSEQDAFEIPSPLRIITKFFEDVESENNKKEKDDEDNDVDANAKDVRSFGAKTSASLNVFESSEERLQKRRKNVIATVTNDEKILLDDLNDDDDEDDEGDDAKMQQNRYNVIGNWLYGKKTAASRSSKPNAGYCRRFCGLCRAKCDRSSFNFKNKFKTMLYWSFKSIQSVLLFVKDGLYQLFVIKMEEEKKEGIETTRRVKRRHRKNNHDRGQGNKKNKNAAYAQQRQHYSMSHMTDADNTY